MKKTDIICNEITENDELVLKYLKSISFIKSESNDDFTITFNFNENEYFTNQTL